VDGVSAREHNKRMLKLGGRWAVQARKALRRPKPPPELGYLIVWYDDIRGGMPTSMGVNALSHSEIFAYRELHTMQMDSFDVDTLRRLDGVWLSCIPKNES